MLKTELLDGVGPGRPHIREFPCRRFVSQAEAALALRLSRRGAGRRPAGIRRHAGESAARSRPRHPGGYHARIWPNFAWTTTRSACRRAPTSPLDLGVGAGEQGAIATGGTELGTFEGCWHGQCARLRDGWTFLKDSTYLRCAKSATNTRRPADGSHPPNTPLRCALETGRHVVLICRLWRERLILERDSLPTPNVMGLGLRPAVALDHVGEDVQGGPAPGLLRGRFARIVFARRASHGRAPARCATGGGGGNSASSSLFPRLPNVQLSQLGTPPPDSGDRSHERPPCRGRVLCSGVVPRLQSGHRT